MCGIKLSERSEPLNVRLILTNPQLQTLDLHARSNGHLDSHRVEGPS